MQFIKCPKLVAPKMVWAPVLLLLVLSMSYSATDALGCKGGFSGLVTMFSVLDEVYDIGCTGSGFKGNCYVRYVVPGNFWDHGCIDQGSLTKCDKYSPEYGVDNYYCCCLDENCNDKSFALKCEEKMKAERIKRIKKNKMLDEMLNEMLKTMKVD